MRAGSPLTQSLRITALYATAGAGWILFSDQAAASLIHDPDTLDWINTLKGWGFVAVTALLLFWLVRRQLTRNAEAAAAQSRAEAKQAHAEDQRALAREEALAAGQRLALATHAAHIGTWEWEIATGRVLADTQMHALYDFEPGQAPSTFSTWLQRIHPDDQLHVSATLQAVLDGRLDYHTQFRLLWPGKQVRHVEAHALVQRAPDGRPLRMIGVNWDITERMLAERRYRLLADHVSDVLWTIDLDTGCYTYVSPSVTRLRGCTAAELIGKPLSEGLTPDSLALVQGLLPLRLKAFLTGDPAATTNSQEIGQYRTDGSIIWTEIVTTFRHKEQGGVEILGVTRDISQRRASELALRESSEQLRRAEEVAGIGHWSFQLNSGIAEGSAGAARIYGLACTRWDLAVIKSIPLPEYRPLLDEALRALVDEGRPYDVTFKIHRPDTGALVTIHSLAEFDPATRTVFGVIQDITLREQALETARAREAKLHLQGAALAATAHAIAITDGRGVIEWINPAFTTLTGYGFTEAIGSDLGKLVQSGQQTEDYYRQLWATISAGDTWRGEIVNRHKDGSLVPEEETITPVRDEQGRITHYIAVKQDITKRRHLQEQVLRSQRLDSVGRLAGGIAHDLNNLLVPIIMAPSVLRDAITDPAALEVLDSLETSANRGAAIIRQLLTFSRGSNGERLPVQLRPIVRDMMTIIHETFPKNIHSRTELPAEPWLVEGDATQLHQVLMNLCVNSRDAMPHGGTLTIAVENVELDAASLTGHPGTAPGPHLLLGVFDSGTGIPTELLDKVCDPFFTTKEVGKGTGLGLATVLGIVQAHHGFVQIGSKPGAGTQVRVYLPAVPSATTQSASTEDCPLPHGRGELILLVDDEDYVRRITRRILEQQGYRVLAASDGAEALARFQQHRDTIRLILTDLLMPFMDGAGLILAVRQIDTAVRIVAISGHTSDGDTTREGLSTISAFLPKPYSRHALLQTVAAALEPIRA